MKGIIRFFDRLEDSTRSNLSRHPIIYSLVGGVAVVLFWRGVWMTADLIPFLTGPVSIIISVLTLLLIGLFVSFFVGDSILISGIKGEKKLIEKTEEEVEKETEAIKNLREVVEKEGKTLQEIKEDIGKIKEEMKNS